MTQKDLSQKIIEKISKEKIKAIATLKLPDLNAYDVNAAIKIIEGTAKSCGITITE